VKARLTAIQKENKRQAILDDIRAGLLKTAQIADKHGVSYHTIYRMRGMVGSEKDLHANIVFKATQDVVALRIADNINDNVVVNENAQIVLAMMREHSQSVMRARGVAALLMDDLEATIRNRAEIEDDIEIECKDDENTLRKYRMKRAVSLSANTKVLADLSGALKTLIGLEREMFNIGQGDDGNGKQSLEDYVLSLPAVN
jgi:hypothetical protein